MGAAINPSADATDSGARSPTSPPTGLIGLGAGDFAAISPGRTNWVGAAVAR